MPKKIVCNTDYVLYAEEKCEEFYTQFMAYVKCLNYLL